MAWITLTPDMNRLDLVLWGCVKSLGQRGGKLEARYQLLRPTNEADFDISKEIGCFQ